MEMMETWFRVQKKGKNVFWFGKSKTKNKTNVKPFPPKEFLRGCFLPHPSSENTKASFGVFHGQSRSLRCV